MKNLNLLLLGAAAIGGFYLYNKSKTESEQTPELTEEELNELEDRIEQTESRVAQNESSIISNTDRIGSAESSLADALQGQISSLEADKQTAQQALSDQVRESEARVTRFEKAADALFDSVVVQQYREQNPGSTKSNQQLTLELGNHFSQLGKFDILAQTDPSFAAKYEQAKTLSRLD